MPRLLILTPTAVTQGGVERILEALAADLPTRGFEVVFGLAKGKRFHHPKQFHDALRLGAYEELDGTSGTSYGRRRAIHRAICRVQPDLVLNARLFDVYPVLADLKASGSPVRHAITLQAFEKEFFADLARYADGVDLCVTSGSLIAQAVSAVSSLPEERIRSIPGGVAEPRKPVVHTADRPLRVGYVGRVEQVQKRVLDLAALASELSRRGVAVEYVVAGDGSARKDLERLLPSARYSGWLTTEQLYESIYPNLDVLVHFAEWEGVTIAPREAMAHGVVPVISRFPGLVRENQFLDGQNALTFPVGDIAAATDAIVRLDRDRSLLRSLSQEARQSQHGVYSAQGASDAWAEALHSALSRPPRRGTSLPVADDSGFLSRAGVPASLAEILRRLRKREHASAGDEWPHWSGAPDPRIERKLAALAASR